MTGRRVTTACLIALAVAFALQAPLAPGVRAHATSAAALPAKLTDQEFWSMVETMSEPDGFFRSDNLVSNEDTYQFVIPDLLRTVKPGGVYVGVGPDQNFTYIANLKPAIVFIPDVRRGNLHMHLMYKALMEMSADRAEFLSKLFSRAKPEGLTASASPEALFRAYEDLPPSKTMFESTRRAILSSLRTQHRFKLAELDDAGIDYILGSFMVAGPFLQYSSMPAGRGGMRYPSFAELQSATDGAGVPRAYLASEENYRTIRAMQRNNLIVPLVGNFGGPKTLRAIGGWVRERGGRITTFYTSNVEQYLFQDQIWTDFVGNIATMPLDETSTLIRSCFNSCISPLPGSRVLMLLDSMPSLVRDAAVIRSYYDVLSRQR